MRPRLTITVTDADGVEHPAPLSPPIPRRQPTPPRPRERIFDHFTGGEPEDARFSRVARAMRTSPFWTSVSEWSEPKPAAGELAP